MAQTERRGVLDELLHMKQQMEQLYSQCVPENPKSANPKQSRGQTDPGEWTPPVDVWENDKYWLAICDLPGVREEDLNVEVAGSQLILSGKTNAQADIDESYRSQRRERPRGTFDLAVSLPEDLNRDEIDAELKHGTLTVRITKQSHPARKITIQAG